MMKRKENILGKHRRHSFQRQLFLAFLSFLLCLALVIVVTIVNFYQFLNNYFVLYCDEIVKQAGTQIESVLHKLDVSQNQAFGAVCSSPLYSSDKLDSSTVYATGELIDSLDMVFSNNDDIENIAVYFPQLETFYTAVSTTDRAKIKDKLLQELFTQDFGTHYEIYTNPDTKELETIRFYTSAKALTKAVKKAACIEVSLKGRAVTEALGEIDLDQSQQIFIVDAGDRIIYDQGNRYTGMNLNELVAPPGVGYDTTTQARLLGGNEITVSYRIEELDWNLIVTVDYMSLFWRTAGESLEILILLCAATALIYIFLAVRKSNKLAAPINELVEHLEKYPAESVSELNIKGLQGDIAVLTDSYNRLIHKIEALHAQNLQKEKERLDAEYKALITQINPHFLFNSLENMRGTAMQCRAPELSNTINALSLMLRYSLKPPEEKVTLGEEIQNLEQYLTVIRSRIDFEIEVNYQVQEEALHCQVVRFLLQPIVENSVHYGFGKQSKSNTVWVEAEKIAESLVVLVRDNGVGCDGETVKKLNQALRSGKEYRGFSYVKGMGIGLSNIMKRLRYTFGDDASLLIASTPGEGLEVCIKIPFTPFTDDHEN